MFFFTVTGPKIVLFFATSSGQLRKVNPLGIHPKTQNKIRIQDYQYKITMASQDETKLQDIDSGVDSFVAKKKRKMTESQLQALAEGRKRRWALRNASGLTSVVSGFSDLSEGGIEEQSGHVSTEEEEAKETTPEEDSGDGDEDTLSSEQSDSDASDNSSDSVSSYDSASTGDSDQPQEPPSVADPKTPPTSPTLKRENARDAKDVKNARAAAKMKKYIEKQQQAARANAPRHLFL